jgi:hypothetical protein
VFTARYALSPYIKQIRFVSKGLMVYWKVVVVSCESRGNYINALRRQNLDLFILNFVLDEVTTWLLKVNGTAFLKCTGPLSGDQLVCFDCEDILTE